MRSRVELLSVLDGYLDLTNFEYKSGKFFDGETSLTRIRTRTKVMDSLSLKTFKTCKEVLLTFPMCLCSLIRERSGIVLPQSLALSREERALTLQTLTTDSPPARDTKTCPLPRTSRRTVHWQHQTNSLRMMMLQMKKKLDFPFPHHPNRSHSPPLMERLGQKTVFCELIPSPLISVI